MKINITTFIIQIINFAVMAYILYKVLYKPLREIMEKRKRLVMADVDRALGLKEDAIKIKETYERLTKEAEGFSKKLVEKAVEEAEETKRKILEEAAREAAAEKEKAAAVIENEHKEMLAALKVEAADVSAELAIRLLAPVADESLNKKLAALMFKELEEHLPITTQRKNRDGVKAVCATAFCLDREDCLCLESILHEYMGPGVKIEHKVEPELIAGLRLWLDGMVFDGSLKGQLAAFRQNAIGGLEGHAGNS
ncbi:MAG: F0F1 ATP synthase subunit delta [Nitrospirota bacterium]